MNYRMFLYQKLRFMDICENKVIHFRTHVRYGNYDSCGIVAIHRNVNT